MIIGIDANEANQKNRVGVGQFAYNVIKELEKIDRQNSYLVYLKEPPLPDFPPERVGWGYRIFGPSKLWTQIALPFKLFTQKEKLNFYDNYFVQEYSKSHDAIIRKAGIKLAQFADLASNHIEEKSYLAIQYMLTEPGDRVKSTNNLKRLIMTIEEEIRNKKKLSLSAIA